MATDEQLREAVARIRERWRTETQRPSVAELLVSFDLLMMSGDTPTLQNPAWLNMVEVFHALRSHLMEKERREWADTLDACWLKLYGAEGGSDDN